jgi:hypothetical protein
MGCQWDWPMIALVGLTFLSAMMLKQRHHHHDGNRTVVLYCTIQITRQCTAISPFAFSAGSWFRGCGQVPAADGADQWLELNFSFKQP